MLYEPQPDEFLFTADGFYVSAAFDIGLDQILEGHPLVRVFLSLGIDAPEDSVDGDQTVADVEQHKTFCVALP